MFWRAGGLASPPEVPRERDAYVRNFIVAKPLRESAEREKWRSQPAFAKATAGGRDSNPPYPKRKRCASSRFEPFLLSRAIADGLWPFGARLPSRDKSRKSSQFRMLLDSSFST